MKMITRQQNPRDTLKAVLRGMFIAPSDDIKKIRKWQIYNILMRLESLGEKNKPNSNPVEGKTY